MATIVVQSQNTVLSVFGRTGAVIAQTGDYSAAQVGALASPLGLTGDLLGNASLAATVVGLQGYPISTVDPGAGYVLYYNGSTWIATPIATIAGSGGGGGGSGVTSFNSRTGVVVPTSGDYTAALVGAVASPLGLHGDLLGNAAVAATVVGLQGYAVSNAAPTARWVLGWSGTQWQATPITSSWITGNNVTTFNGRIGAVVPTTGDYTAAQVGAVASPLGLSGDLSGNAALAATVVGLQGYPISTIDPGSGYVLYYNGTTWLATPINTIVTSGGGGTTTSTPAVTLGPPTAHRDSTYVGKQIAATRVQTNYNYNSSYPTGASIPTYRSPAFTVGPQAISDIEVNYGNWTAFPPDGGFSAASVNVKASLEYSGNFYALYFNGLRTVLISGDANGGGNVWSDPIGIEIPAGAQYYIRTLWTPVSGTAAPISNLPGGWSQAGDHVDATGTLTTTLTSSQYGVGPSSIRAVPAGRVPQIALCGDSRMMGYGDTATGLGWYGRALGTNFVSQNLAALGETGVEWQTSGGHWLRGKYLAGCDYAIDEYGINDLVGGATAAAVDATRITIWQALAQRGIKIFADTLPPNTTSSNNWTTTGGQTVAAWNPARSTHNQWIRAGAPMQNGVACTPGPAAVTATVYTWTGSVYTSTPGTGGHILTGCFDSSRLLETVVFSFGGGQDSGIWQVGAGSIAWTADGLHPNPTGCTMATPAIYTSQFV